MPSRSIWLAAIIGFSIDLVLSSLIVSILAYAVGIRSVEELQLNDPLHFAIGLALPVLMTVIGGAVAGLFAPLNPQPAGALVGGFGLFLMLLGGEDSSHPNVLAMIIAQCVATVLAAFAALLAARWLRARQ